MTLGDMIKEYLQENSMTDFSKESGISRAYAYMLIKNKNNDGREITPSLETIKKVARGIHLPFDEVVARMNDDITIKIPRVDPPSLSISPDESSLLEDYRQLNSLGKDKAREYVEDLKANNKYLDKEEETSSESTA